VAEIELVRALGKIRREPEVTTKHGKLKADRKAQLKTIFVDDLASLASIDEVSSSRCVVYFTFCIPFSQLTEKN
jgi:hypothetical protein